MTFTTGSPKYYKRRNTWLIYINEKEVLYDDNDTLIEFATEEEAIDFIKKLKEDT